MSALKAVTDQSWDSDVAGAKGVTLVDCWAPWCAPCKALMPVIEELAAEFAGEASIVKLDVDDNPQTRDALGVRSIPALILFVDGVERERLVGAVSKTRIAALIDGAL